MIELKRTLVRRLNARRVRIDMAGEDTIIFRNVPTNRDFFNKSSTNMLVRHGPHGHPPMVFVDEDLEYKGTNHELIHSFSQSVKLQGWRVLWIGRAQPQDAAEVVEAGLALLGFDGKTPSAPPQPSAVRSEGGDSEQCLLGASLTQYVRSTALGPTVGRDEQVERVLSCILRWSQPGMALVIAPSGVGKTNLLFEVARRLGGLRPDLDMRSADLVVPSAEALFESQRSAFIAALLDQAARMPDTVLVVEHAELAVSAPQGHLLLTRFLEAGNRLVGTTTPRHRTLFRVSPLARRVMPVELTELGPAHTQQVLDALKSQVASHYRTDISELCVRTCIRAARSLPGFSPARDIALLDAAAARAAVSRVARVTPDDICAAAQSIADDPAGNADYSPPS